MRGREQAGDHRKALAVAIVTALAFGVIVARGPQTDQEAPSPFDTGIVERSGVTLLLLDVEVLDKQGNPVPGLRVEDFVVELNGWEVSIYSLDDLCRPPVATPDDRLNEARTEREPAADEADVTQPPTSAPGAPAQGPESALAEEVRFVFYMDYSQLTPFGRANAVETAR
jgi:hypothetical protein